MSEATTRAQERPEGGDQRVFVNLITLEQAAFDAVERNGFIYWCRTSTTTLLTESQMTVARWGRADDPRYQGRRLLESSRKWNLRAARGAVGEDRASFVRAARARNHEVVAIKRATAMTDDERAKWAATLRLLEGA